MPQQSDAPVSMGTMIGKVIWFNDGRGYGFIRPNPEFNHNGKDVFVHFSALVQEAKRRTLLTDQVVEFELVTDHKGPMAHNVRVVTP